MAAPATTEASEIRRRGRQRLIGAIALVLLLVVFVPMVLDSEPRPSRSVPEIPPRDNPPPLPAPSPAPVAAGSSTVAPVTTAAQSKPDTLAKVDPVPATPGKPIDSRQLTSTPPKIPPAAPIAPKAGAQSTPKLEGFAVQVGAFRDEAKLRQARDKLAAAKVPHYTERLDSSGGALTRLRAGPFPTREAAESAQAQLKRAALDGQVVPLP